MLPSNHIAHKAKMLNSYEYGKVKFIPDKPILNKIGRMLAGYEDWEKLIIY